jgi:carboxyl-terminal processing protease
VLEIEGESTFQMPVDRCIELLTGEPGTDVTIKVMHESGVEEMITIHRRRIVTQTVRGAYRLGDQWVYHLDEERGIGYIRITQFNPQRRSAGPGDRFSHEIRALAELSRFVHGRPDHR